MPFAKAVSETILHTLVFLLERTIRNKEFIVGTFLDIELAFNNVLLEAVIKAFKRFGVKSNLS